MDLVKRISQVKQISAFIKIPNARIFCKVQTIADYLLIHLFDFLTGPQWQLQEASMIVLYEHIDHKKVLITALGI